MTAPNLLGSSTVTGKTALSLLTTSTTGIITVATNTVAKLENLILTNYTGVTVSANVVVSRGGNTYYLGGNVAVPANSVLVLLAKDTSIFLEEGDVLQANASAGTSLSLSAGYELIV